MAPSPLSDPGNVAFLQPFCRSSVAQPSLSMVAASMAATRRFAVLPSCPVSALVVFRCVALWRCPYCDRKSSRVPSCGFCWLGAFFTALEGCDEDILASWYDLES